MRPRLDRFPWVRRALAAVAVLLLATSTGASASSTGAAPPAPKPPTPKLPRGTKVLTIGGPLHVQAIRPGFLGLSLEYWAIPYYAGTNPRAVDPVFVQLVRNLAGGSPPELRIGGDTTDETWWPVPRMAPPAGVGYVLTRHWLETTRTLTAKLRARLILGVNFEADNDTIAATEAKALLAGIGRRSIEALELGNEPELYGKFTWGRSGAPGRPAAYDFPGFEQDFSRIAAALPNVPLAGPAVGGPHWFRYVGRFLSDQRRVSVATLHRYPLQLCYIPPWNPRYPSIDHLFSAWSTRTLAASVADAVKMAHAHRVPLRVDEINTVSCGDVPSVTRSFASALWALDVLFQMARVGVDGVNIHTFPGASYELFTVSRSRGRWRAVVEPEYYGLEMFAQAAPAGSQLLGVTPGAGHGLELWALRAPDHTTRVVVINQGSRTRSFAVKAAAGRDAASLERLQAPGLLASQGITLAGQSFGKTTTTGALQGRARTSAVTPSGGDYVFSVPGASAAMLTLPSS